MQTKNFTPALGYNWLTRFYDFAIQVTMPEQKFRKKLINLISPKDSDTILEFGFGTGSNLILVRKKNSNCKIYGIDIDQKLLKRVQAKIDKLGITLNLNFYDGIKLPYADNTFDKVFSSLVFHHLDKDTKRLCLNELYRVLKPSGIILIGDWGRSKNLFMRIAFYSVQLLDGFKTTKDNVDGLLPKYLSNSGFNNVNEVDFLNTKLGTYSYYKALK